MSSHASEHDISAWLTRLRRGDEKAAVAIYRGYFRNVTAFVRLYVADSVAVEEIVDDTFLAVFQKPEKFEGRSSFKTWLLGIARNQCHDWLRRAKREPALSGQEDDALGALADPSAPALDHLERKQIRQIVRLCMMRLPEAQRQVLYWVFFEELSVDQTAEQVGCASGTVKSRMFHAKSRMADCVRRRLDGGFSSGLDSGLGSDLDRSLDSDHSRKINEGSLSGAASGDGSRNGNGVGRGVDGRVRGKNHGGVTR